MKRDETLEEIWAIRRKLARRFNYDPKKAAAFYQRKQREIAAKIYQPNAPIAADALHDSADAATAAGKVSSPTSYRAPRSPRAKRAK